jgi:GT2 family glycosyltransferase
LGSGVVRQLEAALRMPGVGIAVPRLLASADPIQISAEGLILRSGLRVGSRRNGAPVLKAESGPVEVFAGSGAAMLIKRTVLEDVGLFDEDFVAYYEDVDLCWRARLRGWNVVCVPEAQVFHVRGASSRGLDSIVKWYTERNRIWAIWKNCGTNLVVTQAPMFVAGEVRAALGALLFERSRPYVSPRLAALRGLPRVLQKRRAIQSRRSVSDIQINLWLNRPHL